PQVRFHKRTSGRTSVVRLGGEVHSGEGAVQHPQAPRSRTQARERRWEEGPRLRNRRTQIRDQITSLGDRTPVAAGSGGLFLGSGYGWIGFHREVRFSSGRSGPKIRVTGRWERIGRAS